MNWLADNALPIWVFGAITLTMAAIVYQQTRTNAALLAIVGVLALTATLLAIEHFWETPREAVERTLYEIAAAVEANDVPATLQHLAPTANAAIKSDVETMMPMVEIERARIMGNPIIEVGPGDEPTAATATIRGIILARIKRTGMKGGQNDDLTLTLVRNGDHWHVESYTSKRNWHRALGR
jgi:hypothetical protein